MANLTTSSATGNLTASELVARAKASFASKFPSPTPRKVGEPLPEKKIVLEELEEVEDTIIEELEENEELEIIEVVPVSGKKVISQNSAQAQKLIAKAEVKAPVILPVKLSEMNPDEKKAHYNALSAKALAAKTAKKAQAETEAPMVVNPLGSKVVSSSAPVIPIKESKPKGSTPLSKMTIEELQEVKGTIADVQWNKYYNMACKTAGVEPARATRTINPVKESTPAPAPVTPVEVKEAPAPVIATAPKVQIVKGNKTLAEFTLDEIIAELKARGCKGSIRICAEVEL